VGGFREVEFGFDEAGQGELKPTGAVARVILGHPMQQQLDQAPASARVTATEEVSAFRSALERLDSHLKTDPRGGSKMMRVLGRILSTRLREANRALAE